MRGCGWNALVGAPEPPAHRAPWATRWSGRWRERAARRVHAELIAAGGRPSPWPRRTAVGLAVLVLLVTLAEVALDAAWARQGSGFWHWPGVVLLALVLGAVLQGLLPRRHRPHEVDEVSAEDAPQLHALVRDVAHVVGVAPPTRVCLAPVDNA